MGRRRFSDSVEGFSVAERIKRAKSATEALTCKVLEVIELHEANKIIVFGDKLASQIPRSYAANAFTVFQNTMFNHEVIKCIALWDRADDNVISIPTVVELIDQGEVIAALVESTRSGHLAREPHILNPSDDPEVQAVIDEGVANLKNSFAEDQAERTKIGLLKAVQEAKAIVQQEQTNSIKNLRDHLAHNLTQTRAEQRNPIPPVKYDDEKHLLEVSIQVIEDLYCWVNGTSFDIKAECTEHAKVRAEELWLNCKFDIPLR